MRGGNDSVLFDLTRRSSLRALGYRYVATHSPDVRGIDVALLYQPGSFRLLESHEIPVPSAEAGFRPTRNVLYVKEKYSREIRCTCSYAICPVVWERPVFRAAIGCWPHGR